MRTLTPSFAAARFHSSRIAFAVRRLSPPSGRAPQRRWRRVGARESKTSAPHRGARLRPCASPGVHAFGTQAPETLPERFSAFFSGRKAVKPTENAPRLSAGYTL